MAAVETLITDHLDLWTAALKRKSTAGRGSSSKVELYGIKKLRELILELAARGLLVPQDPNDEPASELLKRIAVERAELVKEGKIKKEKPLPPIDRDELPHYIPEGWGYERFGRLAIIERGGSPRPIQSFLTDQPDGLNWIKIGDTDIGGKYITTTKEKITKEGLSKTRMVYPGDFLLTNSMSFGRPYITKIEGCIHDGWLRICPAEQVDKDFLYLLLSSPYIVKSFTESAAGAVVQNLNSEKVREVLILLPPLAEQHRIVAKVDELMALCNQLEQQTDASLGAHQTLLETLLSALTSAADHTQFASAWQRIASHFDTLFTTEESIDQLKQTILQLAVMGKLVPQDPNDEPASELLKKIAARPHKHTLPGWATVSLGQLGDILGGATPSKSNAEYWIGNIPWVSPKDMKRNLITDAEDHVSEAAISNSSLKKIPPGSLLMVVRGMILAHSFPVAISACEVTINQDMKALVIPPELGAYLLTFMQAMKGAFVALVDRSSHGTCKLVSEKLWSYPVSLPPLAEQHRIVAKVDELMALCDQLKSRLSDAQTTQLHLADALVEQAVC